MDYMQKGVFIIKVDSSFQTLLLVNEYADFEYDISKSLLDKCCSREALLLQLACK